VAILVALFIAVPILELYVIVEVGGLIGVLPTLALLVAMSVLGATLLRHQGRGAWRRFNAAIGSGRFPGREVADGLLITVGGVLLLTPGFATDLVGLLLLIPPSRALARRTLRAYLGRRLVVAGFDRMSRGRDPGTGRAYDYEASAEEVDDARLPDADDSPSGSEPE